jgi:peptidoglycan glycosyltransferase
LYVPRGALLDRNGVVLSQTIGEAGSYERNYLRPEFGNVLGYSHPNYGQSGIEDGLDGVLRGEEFQPTLALWSNHVLYGLPSNGLDVKLTLDAELMLRANELLAGQHGAAVMIDAATGEILVMASQPGFDPTTLDDQWTDLLSSTDSPLLNRAVQGAYPPGTALGPFLLAATRAAGLSPEIPHTGSLELDGRDYLCISRPSAPEDLNELVRAACPSALAQMGLTLGGERMLQLLRDLGFYNVPDIPLDLSASPAPISLERPEAAAIGQGGLRVSPLQMALAACSLSNFGIMPSPQLVLEIEQAGGGWQPFAEPEPDSEVLGGAFSSTVAQTLAGEGLSTWEALGRSYAGDGQVYTWYLAGDLATQGESGRCLAVLLEADDASTARSIGRDLLSD